MSSSSKPNQVTKILQTSSERVKMVDLHPKEPLVLASLYSGQVTLWNYETQTMLKAFEIVDVPVRCVKFITKLQCFICGSDDMNVRVYNYNTMEKIKTFEAHMDYIRGIAVHENLPYVLTCSDDMSVKLWDWSKNWQCTMMFEGHSHYVMQAVFNPKDPSTFATASLDETVMVWNIHSPVRNFMLEGHERGVNTVEYYQGGDKPYLLSGSDDSTVRIWDYQTKACLQTLNLHTHNVTCAVWMPDLPLLFSGSEDESVGVFSTTTWRFEQMLNYNLQRVWTISAKAGLNKIAIGFDKGMVVLRVGSDEPVMSMDSAGKILVAQGSDITKFEVSKAVEKDVADGEHLTLPSKDVGSLEGTPTKILHGPNGQYIAVLTEEEYTVNSALAWRPKCFGKAIAFAWGNETGTFAILENATTLKVFKQFKVKETQKLPAAADQLYAGPLLGARIDGALYFYDWELLRMVRRIDECPKEVTWSDSGELLAIIVESSAYILKYRAAEVQEELADTTKSLSPDGIESAFDVVEEHDEQLKQALWVGDCLVFVNGADRLMYYIGGETSNIAVMARGFFLLGYVAKENRLYCMDRDRTVISYQLYVSVVEYLTMIVREDMAAAAAILPKVPQSMRYQVAKFLEGRDLFRLAMEVTTDDDHRFELAVDLRDLDVALPLCKENPSNARWKQVGDIALELGMFDFAERALLAATDIAGLQLLYSCTGDREKLRQLGHRALQLGRANIAFTCFSVTQAHDECIEVLCAANKVPEAAFYARSYCPEKMPLVVARWRNLLAGTPRVRDCIADPKEFPHLFPVWEQMMKEGEAEEGEEGEAQQKQNDAGDAAAATAAAAEEEEEAAAPPQQHRLTEEEEAALHEQVTVFYKHFAPEQIATVADLQKKLQIASMFSKSASVNSFWGNLGDKYEVLDPQRKVAQLMAEEAERRRANEAEESNDNSPLGGQSPPSNQRSMNDSLASGPMTPNAMPKAPPSTPAHGVQQNLPTGLTPHPSRDSALSPSEVLPPTAAQKREHVDPAAALESPEGSHGGGGSGDGNSPKKEESPKKNDDSPKKPSAEDEELDWLDDDQ